MKMGIAIAGCGVVGSGVAKMLTENAAQIARSGGRAAKLVLVADPREVEVPAGVARCADAMEIFANPDVGVVVETIGGTRVAYTVTKQALSSGRHVVTSNKELVAKHGDELQRLAREHGVQYLYEAAVGGGVPILRPLRICLAGNRILSVEGIVNGSTNYILTRMGEAGASFPAALEEARKNGYVEGNPDADLEGWDARRKLAILASAAFGAKLGEDERIPTTGISALTDRDIRCARVLGGKIKLLARAELGPEGWTGRVCPTFLRPKHPLFAVDGVYNGIIVRGDFVGDVQFGGQGAGSRPTASAVIGDIVEILRTEGAEVVAREALPTDFIPPDADACRYLYRLEAEDIDAAERRARSLLPGMPLWRVGDMLALVARPADAAALQGVRLGCPILWTD